MSQGQSDVSEPQNREVSKAENLPPAKQPPANGVKHEPADTPSRTASPRPTSEATMGADFFEVADASTNDAVLEDDVASLTRVIAAVSGRAANIATRRNWRKMVLGPDHVLESFLVRAILKTTSPHVRRRALDEQAEKLLAAASEDFLDRALALRLRSIDAKDLVRRLAAAGRLGYSEADVIDANEIVHPVDAPARRRPSRSRPAADEPRPGGPGGPSGPNGPNGPGAPVPVLAPRASAQATQAAQPLPILPSQHEPLPPEPRDYAPRLPAMHSMHSLPPTASAPLPPQRLALPTRTLAAAAKHSCPDCGQTFAQSAGRKYHMEKKVCHNKAQILPPGSSKWQCDNCYRIFTTSAGLTYHTKNNVCRDHDLAKAALTDRPAQRPPPLLPSPSGQTFQLGPVCQSPLTTGSSHTQSPRPTQSPPQSAYPAQPAQAIQQTQSPPQPQQPYHAHQSPPAPALQPAQPQPVPTAPGSAPPPPQGQRIYSRPASGPRLQNGAPYKTGHLPGSSNFNIVVAPAIKPTCTTPVSPPILSASMGSQETPIRMPNLDPARLAEMNARLANEELRFKAALDRIPDSLTGFEKDEEVNKQKAGHATRKSVIRRDYGVQLRKRKNRSSTTPSTHGSAASAYNGSALDGSPSSFAPVNRVTSFRGPPSNMMSVMTSNMTPTSTNSTVPANGGGPARPQPQPLAELESPVQKRRKVSYPDSPIQVNSRGMAFSAREPVSRRPNVSDNPGDYTAPRPLLGDVYGIPRGTQGQKVEDSPAQSDHVQASPQSSPMDVDHDVTAHNQNIRYNPSRQSTMDTQAREAQQPGTRPLLPLQNQSQPAPAATLPAPVQYPPVPPRYVPSLSQPVRAIERITISSGSETCSDSSDADADNPARALHYARRRTSMSIDSARRTSISMESGGSSARVSPSVAARMVMVKSEAEVDAAKRTVTPTMAESLAAKAASALASAAAQAGDVSSLASDKTSTGMSTPTSGGTGAEAGGHDALSSIASLAMVA